jgi:hypothetical protein
MVRSPGILVDRVVTFLLLLSVHLDPTDKVSAMDFKILKLLGTGAYGR